MPSEHLSPVISFIRRIAAVGLARRVADGQLLARFAAHQDQAAFSALVHRHGPMVLGVCQRVLQNHHDAEDAFQATFLVLARKAGSIGEPEKLGNWLYGVAYRTALEAKTRRTTRLAKERQAVNPAPEEPFSDAAWAEIRQALDEEINRLPSRYRWPFVLCCLEGKTNEEAARVIGCPEGTICSRLAWARQRLRSRLTRRGVGLSVGLFSALLTEKVSCAAAPSSLSAATVKAALEFVMPGAAVGSLPSEAAILSRGVLAGMRWAKIKVLAGIALVSVTLLGAGAGTGMLTLQSEGPVQAVSVTAQVLRPTPAMVTVPRQGQEQENEGEKLFRAMEEKVRSANSLKVACEMNAEFGVFGQSSKLKGAALLAEGNRAHFEFESGLKAKTFKTQMVSDGNQVLVGFMPGFQAGPWPTKPDLGETLAVLIARAGLFPAALAVTDVKAMKNGLDIAAKLSVSDFKLIAREVMDEREAVVIEYSLTIDGGDTSVARLWLDSQTLLPLKRQFAPRDRMRLGVSEIYTEFVLEPPLNAQVFELPDK